jgi:hypothetical protein
MSFVSLIARYATLGTVFVGVVFGILTTRQWRHTRSLTAAVDLIRTIQPPEFARSIRLILELPRNADPKVVVGDYKTVVAAFVVSHVFESLGVLVFYRLLPLHLVDHLIGGYVRASWLRLKPYVVTQRLKAGLMLGEWFQWLAERMEECPAPGKEEGAAVAYRDWRA